jgi:hypothetical protein
MLLFSEVKLQFQLRGTQCEACPVLVSNYHELEQQCDVECVYIILLSV